MPAEASDKCCVLLVDDDPDTRTMYALALGLAQFDVLESGDGATALSTASDRLPDVVVTDLLGPNLDGFELLECRLQPESREWTHEYWTLDVPHSVADPREDQREGNTS